MSGASVASMLPTNIRTDLATPLVLGGLLAGGISGTYKSLRKSEMQNHPDRDPSTFGQYTIRGANKIVGGSVLAPVVDYLISRKMMD